MVTIICPTILFISNSDWLNNNTKDLFLSNLKIVLEFIINNNHKLYWNDNLEELLWNSPALLPWYSNESYRLVDYLQKCVVFKNESCGISCCNITPTIVNDITEKDIISPSLSLIHYIIINNLDFLFIVDEKNDNNFEVTCNCHGLSYVPKIKCINNLCNIDIPTYIENEWDNFTTDIELFKKAIIIFINEYFGKINALYELEFSSSFLSEVNCVKTGRKDILYSIASRIVKNQKDACNSKSLKDEPIHGYKNRRCFRVNGECRIQYSYPSKGVIMLITYSSEGEHNKKLSHTRR